MKHELVRDFYVRGVMNGDAVRWAAVREELHIIVWPWK